MSFLYHYTHECLKSRIEVKQTTIYSSPNVLVLKHLEHLFIWATDVLFYYLMQHLL